MCSFFVLLDIYFYLYIMKEITNYRILFLIGILYTITTLILPLIIISEPSDKQTLSMIINFFIIAVGWLCVFTLYEDKHYFNEDDWGFRKPFKNLLY